jgi:hypothetical protein
MRFMIRMFAAVPTKSGRLAHRSEWLPRRRSGFVASALLAGLECLAGSAKAEQPAEGSARTPEVVGKVECARSFEQAQRLRNAFHYIDAGAEALKCANPACGPLLSEECGKIYGELQAVMPSIVFVARDESGNDLTNASVLVAGNALPISVDGTPVTFDPGSHEFTFTAEGFEPLVQSAMIRTGERLRPLIGVLKKVRTVPASQLSTRPQARIDDQPNGGPPLATYILGGVGLVGFAGFVGFRIVGAGDFDSLSRECKPDCSQDAVDDVRQKYVFSNIALAVGAAATVAALTVYLVAPGRQPSTTALQISHFEDGASARVTTSF